MWYRSADCLRWPHSQHRVAGAKGAAKGFGCRAAFQEADRRPVVIQKVLGPLPQAV